MELQLEQHSVLASQWVADLGDLVTRSADLDQLLLDLDTGDTRQGGLILLAFPVLTRGASFEVCLMLAALGVGEVGAVVLVDCQAETAFEGAHVVLEDVGIFLDIHSFHGDSAKSLTSVGVGGRLGGDAAAAELGTSPVLRDMSARPPS